MLDGLWAGCLERPGLAVVASCPAPAGKRQQEQGDGR